MSYATVAVLRRDRALLDRVAGCAALEGIADPEGWAMSHAWKIAAQPGWVDAWESAQGENSTGDHGANEDVITEVMILDAVRALNA